MLSVRAHKAAMAAVASIVVAASVTAEALVLESAAPPLPPAASSRTPGALVGTTPVPRQPHATVSPVITRQQPSANLLVAHSPQPTPIAQASPSPAPTPSPSPTRRSVVGIIIRLELPGGLTVAP